MDDNQAKIDRPTYWTELDERGRIVHVVTLEHPLWSNVFNQEAKHGNAND